ncbi:glutathione S-transferase [Sphaerosporella brunnea]|uniref:Glutathione S-transferase n=1 Tax=Sphaerosporella brunnea TaxID=1250544 RepID=A0A5J5F1T9_9PEZI|nr:glutathione S-transferase [Sphaerosporella brunnea]
MAPFASIWTWPNNPRLLKTLAAAKLNGLEIEFPPFTFGTTNVDPAFRAKFTFGKVPVLETHGDSPLYLAESSAIAHFVADSGPAREQLLGADPVERAKIQQWIMHSETELGVYTTTGVYPKLGYRPYSAEEETKAIAGMDRLMAVIEKILSEQEWLVITKAGKLSMADLAVASCLHWALKLWLDKEWRAKWPKTMEWFKKTIESEGVKEVWEPATFLN